MKKNLIESQFEELKLKYKNSLLIHNKDGSKTIVVYDITLPKGWSKNKTSISFDILECYPFCNPKYFSTDLDLRLNSGARPRNTNDILIKFSKKKRLMFLWSVSKWNPNRDTLITYVHVIEQRFKHIE